MITVFDKWPHSLRNLNAKNVIYSGKNGKCPLISDKIRASWVKGLEVFQNPLIFEHTDIVID